MGTTIFGNIHVEIVETSSIQPFAASPFTLDISLTDFLLHSQVIPSAWFQTMWVMCFFVGFLGSIAGWILRLRIQTWCFFGVYHGPPGPQ